MTIELSLEARTGYLAARVSGDFDLVDAQAASVQFLKACVARRLPKVLVDIRQMRGPISDTQRFRYSEYLAGQVVRLSRKPSEPIRLAYVGHEPVIDRERFGATVAYNRGVRIFATESLAEALDWLGVAETDPRA